MKRRMILGAIVLLLILQAQTVFAFDYWYDFGDSVKAGNFSRAERILKSNDRKKWSAEENGHCWGYISRTNDINNTTAMRAVQLLRQYNVGFGFYTVSFAMNFEKSEELVRYLMDSGMPLGNRTVFVAIENGYSDNLVQTFLDKRAGVNSECLRKAAEKRRWTLVPLLIDRLNEDDMNYRRTRDEYTAWYNSQPADLKKDFPFSYDPIESKTALMFAAQAGQLRIVRLLVEHGARVNLRAEGGETAASLAYDNGEIEVYNYLKEKGAIDYEPRQVTQQPTPQASTPSTTNVYVQPSAPAPAPAPARTQTPSTPTLQTGRYAYSGTNVTMELLPVTRFVTLYSGYTTVGNGSYNINGNTITITILQASGVASSMVGKTYAYTIMSDTSFSGNGETWYKR
jgi:hypothetical protein